MLASILTILIFGVIHSLLAGSGSKMWMRRRIGERAYEGFYRLLYNVFSTITFLPVGIVVLLTPARILWQVPLPWASILVVLQLTALTCLVLAVLQADPLRFAGLRQALAYWRGEPLPLPPEPLQTGGLYKLVRHPLYLFSLLVLWPVPVMTDVYLGFVIGATIYFLAGSMMEERRLAAEFGDDYHQYRRRVPWIFPWPRPRA